MKDARPAQVLAATSRLFGDHPLVDRVESLVDEHARRLEHTSGHRAVAGIVMAIVGMKGQGKSWIAGSFVRDDILRRRIRSGILSEEATVRLHWVGPTSPQELQPRWEEYTAATPAQLLPMPFGYTVLDTPGTTDARVAAASLVGDALAAAPVHLLVSRRDNLRSAEAAIVADRTGGSITLPIITAADSVAEAEEAANRWVAELRQQHSATQWLDPIIVEDFEATGDEDSARTRLQKALAERLVAIGPDEARAASLRQHRRLQSQFDAELRAAIAAEMPELVELLRVLGQRCDEAIPAVVQSILGSRDTLRSVLATRMRAAMVSYTPAIYFPYRTMLSVLALTHSAWDRLVLAMSGSLPSLILLAVGTGRQLWQANRDSESMENSLQNRSSEIARQEIQPVIEQIEHVIRSVRGSGFQDNATAVANEVRFVGLPHLQSASAEIVGRELEQLTSNRWSLQLLALTGTLIFWGLFIAPLISLYRDYLSAAGSTLRGNRTAIGDFPTPPLSFIGTPLLLSLLPLAIFCMVALSVWTRRRRLERVVDNIMRQHHAAIDRLRSAHRLQIAIDNAVVRDAMRLVQSPTDHLSVSAEPSHER